MCVCVCVCGVSPLTTKLMCVPLPFSYVCSAAFPLVGFPGSDRVRELLGNLRGSEQRQNQNSQHQQRQRRQQGADSRRQNRHDQRWHEHKDQMQ